MAMAIPLPPVNFRKPDQLCPVMARRGAPIKATEDPFHIKDVYAYPDRGSTLDEDFEESQWHYPNPADAVENVGARPRCRCRAAVYLSPSPARPMM